MLSTSRRPSRTCSIIHRFGGGGVPRLEQLPPVGVPVLVERVGGRDQTGFTLTAAHSTIRAERLNGSAPLLSVLPSSYVLLDQPFSVFIASARTRRTSYTQTDVTPS